MKQVKVYISMIRILCSLVSMSTAHTSATFSDDFEGTALDINNKWKILTGPGSFIPRTQFQPPTSLPVVSDGVAWLRFDTYNPSALTPGDSFFGTDIKRSLEL